MGNLSYSQSDSFKLVGKFWINNDKNNAVDGILYHTAKRSVIKTMGRLTTTASNSGRFLLQNSHEAVIYGYLENGLTIRVNKYVASYYKDSITIFKGEFLVFNFDILNYTNISDFDFPTSTIYLRFNNLYNWLREIPNKQLNFAEIECEGHNLLLKLEGYKTTKQIQKEKVQIELMPQIILKMDNYSYALVQSFIKKLTDFFTILSNTVFNVTHEEYVKSINTWKILSRFHFQTNFNENNSQFTNINQLNFVYQNVKSNLNSLLLNYLKLSNTENDHYPLLESLLIFLESNQSDLSSFLNYINAIDSSLKNEEFSNHKKIKNLKDKVRRMINSIPNPLKKQFFKNDESLSEFTDSVVDTRDYRIHKDKSNSVYLLNDPASLMNATTKLHYCIYVYVLQEIGISESLIISNFEPVFKQVASSLFINI